MHLYKKKSNNTYWFLNFAVFTVETNATHDTLVEVQQWFDEGNNVAVS